MPFYADLHVHSKYSRATSKDLDLEHLALWARRKGIEVVATGDLTHPAWWRELSEKLVPAEPGLYRLLPEIEREVDAMLPAPLRGPTRFMLSVEISTIYKKGDKTRKVHHLIYAAEMETAARFREALGRIGNIESDGRPILGLDSRDLLEITLDSGPDAYLVPAHIWTPWFAALGSKSGFDSIEECYGDLSEQIFAVETGLSSDPPMNWRVSSLDRFTLVSNSDAHSPGKLGREACVFDCERDYFAMRRALETREGYGGTVEFFPEEGKYHADGHRSCEVRLDPKETLRLGGRCPECGKPLTVGVLHRVEALADRDEGAYPDPALPFRSLVPLPEILGEIHGVGPKTKTVSRTMHGMLGSLGPELPILESMPVEDVERLGGPLFGEAVRRLRRGDVRREAGYDGEYGVIRLFDEGEIERLTQVGSLFPEFREDGVGTSERVEKEERADPATTGDTTRPRDPAPDRPPPAAAAVPDPVPATTEAPPADADPGDPSPLARLDPDQREAASVVDGPLLIVAGPGTGKTRTLTHRVAHLITSERAEPSECLTLTFTRRAAEEMRERLRALLPEGAEEIPVTTFHGLGLSVVREMIEGGAGEPRLPTNADPTGGLAFGGTGEDPIAGLRPGFQVADKTRRTAILQETFDLSEHEATPEGRRISEARKAAALAAFARRRGTPGQVATSEPEADQSVAAYERALRERNLVDFDDLLILPVRILTERPGLRDAYRRRWAFVSVDEYQDVDAIQAALLSLLVPRDGNLCAIGDPDQSIYSFRGADVSIFLRFRDEHPSARVVHLTRNYRSGRAIVDASLDGVRPSTLVEERALHAVRSGTIERVTLHEAASEKAEAEFVAHTIERLIGGTSYFSVDTARVDHGEGEERSFGDFAVLARTAALLDSVQEALHRLGVPTRRVGHRRLAEDDEVRRVLEVVEEVVAGSESSTDWLGPALDAADAPEAVAHALRAIAAGHPDDPRAFLEAARLADEVDTYDPRADRVSLLTLHAAKGLEFPVVFVIGCEDGILPLRWGPDDEVDEAEERRLLFVGMTRARERLYLTRADRRIRRGQLREMEPSPFLGAIREALVERSRTEKRGGASGGPEASREQLGLF